MNGPVPVEVYEAALRMLVEIDFRRWDHEDVMLVGRHCCIPDGYPFRSDLERVIRQAVTNGVSRVCKG